MTTTKDPIETDLMVDADELSVDELPSDESTLLARIPLLAGSNNKAAYLAYRSCGFTITQACDLAGIHIATVHKWRKIDKVFKRFEEEELQHLQDTVGNDVLRFEFMRNMRMLLHKDTVLIAKGLSDLEGMTDREYELFKALRRFYTPSELLAIEKVLHPEKHHDGPIKITLSWGNRVNITDAEPDIDLLDSPSTVDGQFRELAEVNADSN